MKRSPFGDPDYIPTTDSMHRTSQEKRSPEDNLTNLVVPGADAAMEAGKLLENLLD